MESQKIEPTDLNAHVHPDLKDFLAKMPELNIARETIVETRRVRAELYKAALVTRTKYDDITALTQKAKGYNDSPEVPVKIYNSKPDQKQPGLLWIHGGGYIMGTADQADGICKFLAYEADCVVVSVDYRLAPEHPFPAALDDCYSALVWMKDSAQELGINIKKIAVAGPSAGGGLCAALTLLARDRKGPEICFQIPLYPMIDNRNVTPSSHQIVDSRVWNRNANIKAWEMYLGDHVKGEISPYATPSRAIDFSGLPSTFTFVGALDPFRDEDIEYVTKLLQAKVPVEFHIYPGCFHGFDIFFPQADISKAANASIVRALKQAFAV